LRRKKDCCCSSETILRKAEGVMGRNNKKARQRTGGLKVKLQQR
jgi:hypothetical protein